MHRTETPPVFKIVCLDSAKRGYEFNFRYKLRLLQRYSPAGLKENNNKNSAIYT